MSFNILPSVNVALIKDNKVLLSRRQSTGWMDGHLCLPGGHVEEGDTPRQGAIRELKEELGLELTNDDLDFICVAARNTKPNQYVAYEFMVKAEDLNIVNAEPNKCSELVWVNMDALPKETIKDFAIIIRDGIVKRKRYLEIGF